MAFFLDFTAPASASGIVFTSVTVTSLSTGVVHSDSGGNLTSSLLVNADVSASAAIAGTKVSPDFGAQAVTTTGLGTFLNVTVSALGVGIAHVSAAGVVSSSTVVNADVDAAAAIAGTKIAPDFGSQAVVTTSSVTSASNVIAVGTAYTFTQTARSTDAATNTITETAQAAWASAVGANLNGADRLIRGGARGSTSGKRGGVKLGLNGTSEYYVEVCDVQPAATSPSRAVVLCRGAAITTTEMPTGTGDQVIYIGNAAVVPTVAPVSGGVLYETAGSLQHLGPSGTLSMCAGAVTALKVDDYQVLINDRMACAGTLTKNITFTLPASPTLGQAHAVKDVNGTCGSPFTITVSGGAKSIDGFGTSVVYTTGYFSRTYTYTGTIWSVT